jgi:hypothetical protein
MTGQKGCVPIRNRALLNLPIRHKSVLEAGPPPVRHLPACRTSGRPLLYIETRSTVRQETCCSALRPEVKSRAAL